MAPSRKALTSKALTSKALTSKALTSGAPTRRSLIAGAATLAAAGAATGWWALDHTTERAESEEQPDASMAPEAGGLAPAGRVAYLAVIAHPDDDLYFMNPGIENALRTGAPVTTVVLTAAEGEGRNTPDQTRYPAPLDVPGYVRARQNGLRSAYAVMAGLSYDTPWTTSVIDLAGSPAELTTLNTGPGTGAVSLVFLNIADNPWGPANRTPLAKLWNGLIADRPVIASAGGAVQGAGSFTRDSLIDAVAAAMDRFRPTTVWTTDPDPERRDPGAPVGIVEYGDYTDCEDHTAAARFALAALQRYQTTAAGSAYQLETFCGYTGTRWPESLNPAVYREKLRILAVYGWADHHHCADHAGCGDLGVGDGSKSIGWPRRTNRRHSPGAGPWLTVRPAVGRGSGPGIEAFGVAGGQAAVLTPGRAAVRFGPGILAPSLARADTVAGATWLAALHLDNSDEGDRHHQVVVAQRPDPRAAFGPWRTLGAPDLHHGGYAQVVGLPQIAVGHDGVTHVVVRNGARGLSLRSIARDGTPGPWTNLGGHRVADAPSLVVGHDGVVEVYQAAGKGILRWRLDRAAPKADDIGAPESAVPATAVVLPDGRVRVFLRRPTSGAIVAITQRTPGGAFDPVLLACGGAHGYGPMAAAVVEDMTVLAQRRNNGAVGIVQVPHDGGPVSRQSGGPLFVGQPAVAGDGAVAYVAVVGPDSRLAVGRVTRVVPPPGGRGRASHFEMAWV